MSTYKNNNSEEGPLTVAQVAVSQPGALQVFLKYNIDYCCGGHRSLEEACLRIGLDPLSIRREIQAASAGTNSGTLHPVNWSSSFLIDFIVQNHHSYVRKAMPEIQELLDKVCSVHGDESVELLNIRESFLDLSEELFEHMEKEEQILFPSIKRLEAANFDGHPLSIAIQPPLAAMEHEHNVAGDLIKMIRSLSNNYTPPEFACPTFRITYQKLQEFDNDLMNHIHLENNVLFERFKDTKLVGNSFDSVG